MTCKSYSNPVSNHVDYSFRVGRSSKVTGICIVLNPWTISPVVLKLMEMSAQQVHRSKVKIFGNEATL